MARYEPALTDAGTLDNFPGNSALLKLNKNNRFSRK